VIPQEPPFWLVVPVVVCWRGGGIGLVTIYSTTEALWIPELNCRAGNIIRIEAINKEKYNQTIRVDGFGGAAGLVGLGAAVAYLDE
jgi:hypothetical protein